MNGLEGSDRADEPATRLRENAVGIASTLVTGIWLAGLLTGQSWWLPALVVGYAAVVPIVATLFGADADRETWTGKHSGSERGSDAARAGTGGGDRETDGRDALETLRERYAAGELTDEQFEHKLERLLETGTLEDADEWVHRRDRESDRPRDLEYDR